MFTTRDWNIKQARLKEIILKEENFSEASRLLSDMHSTVHDSAVYKTQPTYMDEIWNNMDEKTFCTMPTVKDATPAWDIWHITRIEDITANILIAQSGQVLDGRWQKGLNTSVKDTGNAMTDEEILSLSAELSMDGLRQYRNAVGERTKDIIGSLKHEDMRRAVNKADLARILEEGGVTSQSDSIWLLDFWGRKNVAGLLLMPVTRHQVVHLNDCAKLKEKCGKMRLE